VATRHYNLGSGVKKFRLFSKGGSKGVQIAFLGLHQINWLCRSLLKRPSIRTLHAAKIVSLVDPFTQDTVTSFLLKSGGLKPPMIEWLLSQFSRLAQPHCKFSPKKGRSLGIILLPVTGKMAESSNSTISWDPPTFTPENWSGGSALAVLVALAIGCLAHPRGSLTFNKSGRIWRVSPHLGLVEALNLASKLLVGLMRGYSLHVVCVTLLAIRYGKSWTSTEYNSYQEAWEKQHTKKEENRVTESQSFGDSEEMRAISGARGQHAVNEDVIPPVGRSATIEAEEGRANVNLHQRTNRAAGPHDEEENILENRDGNSTQKDPQASPDTIFLSQLKETEQYEKGLTFRPLVWIPMLLSFVKIFSGTGGWSVWGPKVCGCMFLCSWFVTELISIVASRQQLSEEQREASLKLGRLWRKSLEVIEVRHARTRLKTELSTLWVRQHQQDIVRREKVRRKWQESQHKKMKFVAELLAIEALQRQQSKERWDTVSELCALKEEKKGDLLDSSDRSSDIPLSLGTQRSLYPESDMLHHFAWIQYLASGY